VTRRRRGIQPPAPSDYGTPAVRWHPSGDHDPVHVAALSLQHLVLCGIRRLAGEDVTAHLSRLLGVSFRTAQRIAAGDHLLRVDEIVELACLFGDDVLEAIPHTVMDLFPEPYRPLLMSWRAGGRELPAFATPRVPEMIVWPEPAVDLSQWLAGELHAGRMGLVNVSVAAHHMAESLADADIPSSLIVASRSDVLPVGWLGLDVLTRIPTRLLFGYLLDPVDEPAGTMRDILSAFYGLVTYEGQRMAVLCLGQRMSGQFRVYLPGLLDARMGDTLTLPFQVAGGLGVVAASGHEAPDLTLTLEVSVTSDCDIRVLAVRVGKAI
jgi:hypothetical protein